jgi:hypothetical protein
MHSWRYRNFEGEIPRGQYGGGFVRKHEEGKLIIKSITPRAIRFRLTHRNPPEEYLMVRPPVWTGKKRDWLLIRLKSEEENAQQEAFNS